MGDETLSQGDIDALLKGLDAVPAEPAAPPPAAMPAAAAAPAARSASGPMGNIQRACMAAAETATMDLSRADLPRKVDLQNVSVVSKPGQAAIDMISLPAVIFHGGGPGGGFLFAISKDMGARVSDIKMGGDGTKPPPTLSDLYLSAVSEFSNLISGSFFTQLGSGGLSNPKMTVAESREDLAAVEVLKLASCSVLTASASIQNLTEGQWIMVMGEQPAAPMMAPAPAAPVSVSGEARPVQKVEFGSFEASPAPEMPANLNLLLDVPMNVTVELGRTKMTVHDVLNLGSGSIVELDKLAGEPVDFMVNGKLIAKGEVVVIDENFGLRITDIVTPIERFGGTI